MKEKLIYKCKVGSQAYGTAIQGSDEDFKGIYVQGNDDILSFRYKEQIEVSKDEVYYEVRRFLQLAQSANPTILEMLFMHPDCIVISSPQFELLQGHKEKFLTKKCAMSFGGYAVAQIKKARGLNKKMNWEKDKVQRKDLLDFCYVLAGEKSIPWKEWNSLGAYDERFIGAVHIPKAKDSYALFYDSTSFACFGNGVPEANKEKMKQMLRDKGKPFGFGYKGLVKVGDEDESGKVNYGISNQLRLSSVPKGEKPFCTILYNKDGFTQHCKEYLSYQDWMLNHNPQRYVDNNNHGQKIDSKNMLHCRRLIDMAIEIATEGTINVLRPNREYLLNIRRGEVMLDDILEKAEEDILLLNELYNKSSLPESVDMDFTNDLLLQIRHFKPIT